MINKLLNLKESNKWLFWLLIPLVALAFIVKILMKLNILGAKRDLKRTEKETSKLQKEKVKLIKQAEKLELEAANGKNNAESYKKEAENIRNRIKEIESGKVDLDWHKRIDNE